MLRHDRITHYRLGLETITSRLCSIVFVVAVAIARCSGETHGNAIATYVLPSGQQAIAYIDVNHHVDQVFYQGNQWLYNDLTANTNTPVAMEGSALVTYVLPSGV